jgi:ATP-dependent 26S proteasome regulatory subunit
MTQRDRDPLPERPISAEWNGSKISIYDIEGIIQDASSNKTAIYDRSDFPHPIERLQVTAEVIQPENEDALALKSAIQLARTQSWNVTTLNNRFQKYLAPQNQYNSNFQKRPPYHIKNTTFYNSYLIADEETGSKFMLWINHNSGKIIITNKDCIKSGEKTLEIHPPAMHTISVKDQLVSLMRLTALAADFVNAFDINNIHDSRIAGIPLKREYIVGQERRLVTKRNTAKHLGEVGLKGTSSIEKQTESDNYTWEEAHGIEKFKPEEAITLSDIGGLERVKKILQDVATSFKHPEIMEKWGAKRPQGVLLYGEPGTGKTMLAQALANEIGAEMWALQSTDIYQKWLGNSEQRIKEIFNRVRQSNKPVMLFFDEFESIVGITDDPSPGGADNARNAVAGIFKQEMNTLAKENPNILVVAATNSLEKIDSSLIRSGRFDYKIYVPMPDQNARQEIILNLVSKTILDNEEGTFKIFGDDINISELTTSADGFSGADITEIFRRLSLSRAMEEARSGQAQPPISQTEIKQAIQDFRTAG